MEGMLHDLLMMSLTSMSGRLSCLLCKQPSSVAAKWRSNRRETDFFLSRGLSLKNEPSHSFITSSTFSVLKWENKSFFLIEEEIETMASSYIWIEICVIHRLWDFNNLDLFMCIFCLHVCVPSGTCLVPTEVRCPGTGVANGWEPPSLPQPSLHTRTTKI